MSEDNRKNYWNGHYLDYWKSRVTESNEGEKAVSKFNSQDVMTATDRNYEDAMLLLQLSQGDHVLEMGCGFGRSIPYIYRSSHTISAVDISEAMIQEAKKSYGDWEGVQFFISEAESLPFRSGEFDKVICFSVFDALYQKPALIELNRVTRHSGLVLLTGKNDLYFADDEKAYVAEVNARKKEHPNYFTDLALLLPNLESFGFELVVGRYFERRGDTALNQYTITRPERFYEYTLILKKIADVTSPPSLEIASAFSKTFSEHERS